jgi:hypothetical protein
MAVTPGDLTHMVAELLAIPLNTVKNYDRKLMEAGLRSKKGHGRGSAIMTPSDAVSLLIGAACVGCEINKIASAVKVARALPFEGADTNRKVADPDLLLLSKVLNREASKLAAFGPAMDAVMSHLVATGDENTVFSFQITIVAGAPAVATILISGKPFGKGKELHFVQVRGLAGKLLGPSLMVRSEVNWEVTMGIANLLASRAA